jgi:hypothetical protein
MFAFIKTPPIGSDLQRHIFSANTGATNRWNLHVVDTSGNLQWFHNGGVSKITALKPDDDQWHLVGVSRDASNNFTVYLDAATEAIGTSGTVLLDAPVTIGGRPPTSTNFFFKGFIDDARVYNRVLTALDIQALLDQPMPSPGDPNWIVDASGSWHEAGNWSAAVPNSNTAAAVLSPLITAPRTIVVDSPVTVKSMRIDSGAGYIVGGTSTFTFDADAGSASLNVPQGSHGIQASVGLADHLTSDVASGATLSFDNALQLNGNTLTKNGAGRMNGAE